MSYIFGDRSNASMIGLHPDMVMLAQMALQLSDVDFTVIEGFRSPDRQAELVLAGASQTKMSKHLIGHAIDVAAYVNGIICWEWPHYPKIASAFQAASRELGIPVIWGACWDRQLASLTDDLVAEVGHYKARRSGKAFIDSGHFELRFDTVLTT
jgi:peptidoglycan L-alanyl-D-glutamate endopeptidase CwlK